jgi:hypothetical protein
MRFTRPAADELVYKVLRAVEAENEPDQIGAHHPQDVEHPAGRANVTYHHLSSNCVQKNRANNPAGNAQACTSEGGSAFLAAVSDRMNSTAS